MPPNLSARLSVWLVCFGTAAFFTMAMIGWHNYVPDDVFFYLKIADSLQRGLGSTFNGLVMTNGYHPLWMLVAWLGRAIAGEDPARIIRVHFAFCALGNVAAIVLAYRLARVLRSSGAVAPAVIALNGVFNFVGSEQHLSLPLLLWCLLFATALSLRPKTQPPSTRSLLFGGLLFGATVLARLDNVFVLASLALFLLFQTDVPRQRWRRAGYIGLGASIIVAPYLLWNLIAFQHLVPISGAIKKALAQQMGWNPSKLGHQGQVLCALTLLAPFVGFQFWRARGSTAVVFFAIGSTLHALYVLLRMEAVWTWYFSGELIVSALVLEQVVTLAMQRLGSVPARVLSALLPLSFAALLLGTIVVRARYVAPATTPFYIDAGRWLDEHVPEGQGIAVCCSPGSLGFFTHRPIFALDGLTGDYAFHELAAREGLYPALHRIGVRYLLSVGPESIELPGLIQTTRERGHGGEGASFEGLVEPGGTNAESAAVGLFSPLVARHVGWLRTSRENLVGADFCERRMGLWRLQPLDGEAVAALGQARAAMIPAR